MGTATKELIGAPQKVIAKLTDEEREIHRLNFTSAQAFLSFPFRRRQDMLTDLLHPMYGDHATRARVKRYEITPESHRAIPAVLSDQFSH
jgi:hypothetical protein